MTPANEPVDILLVDDRRENLLALEAILEPLGQRLRRATSGEDALRCLLERDFAVILLDVQMPGMNGFETAQVIKSRQRTKFIPIIFLTAISENDEYVFEGYSVGAVDYLFKPFQPEVLRSKVQVFVELYAQQRRIAEQEHLLHAGERRETELRHAQEMLQSEARFRDIVNTAMDAIIGFDAGGRVTLMNGAAEHMLATRAADAMGAPLSQFFPDGLSAEWVRATCDSKSTVPYSLTAVRADGQRFPIEASMSCLEAAEGQTYALIVRDVSERVAHEEILKQQATSLSSSAAELTQLNSELSRRQQELERAMTARSRFYASMSHELRTPINAVLGYSALLLERIYGPLNDKQALGIERTQRAARHLLELVNDVLDLSKIEAGKIELRLQPVEFPAVIEELLVTVRPFADEHNTPLSIDQPENARPLRVITDPRRVRQILLNLLSNAIKFGAGKAVRVVCAGTDDGGISISVIDQGSGISSEDQERVFQEFVQLGATQRADGTGLGLPISRRLAETLRGSLTVESTLGAGSTFRLRLPASADVRRSGQVVACEPEGFVVNATSFDANAESAEPHEAIQTTRSD